MNKVLATVGSDLANFESNVAQELKMSPSGSTNHSRSNLGILNEPNGG